MWSLLPVHPVIELAFDPVAQVGDWLVRLQTLALAAVLFVALLVAARIARRTPVDVDRSPDDLGPDEDDANHLRRDDLLYIVVASIPGAVLAGRLGYALVHLDYYTATSGALLDIGQGGFQLSMAVVGGTVTAVIVASLLGAPLGRWLHAAILPLLLAIGGGKLAMILGGEGQGIPFDGAWATAYLGPGPWLSLAPSVPSNPSQAYEGLATLGVVLFLVVLLSRGAFERRAGGVFFLGLALWALVRLIVAFTWRDPKVMGPLSMDQLLSIAIAVVSIMLLGAIAARARGRRPGEGSRAPSESVARTPGGEPDWPDPAARPRI